ncbi:MAG: methyltransferase, partial [Promethearchaeia archaeon]
FWDKSAWDICSKFRAVAMVFEFICLGNIVLWWWFPVRSLSCSIFPSAWISLVIGAIILSIGGLIMFLGMKDAGAESSSPSPDTELFGGIYRYIRHPQALGEFPMFPALALLVNSLFLFVVLVVYVLFYLPIMILVEERDLVRRFGKKYTEYKRNTGALFPKFNKKKRKNN